MLIVKGSVEDLKAALKRSKKFEEIVFLEEPITREALLKEDPY